MVQRPIGVAWPKSLMGSCRPWPKVLLKPHSRPIDESGQEDGVPRKRAKIASHVDCVRRDELGVERYDAKESMPEDAGEYQEANLQGLQTLQSWVSKEPHVTYPQARPEELEPGTAVFYWNGRVGIVQEAFIPLDLFWLQDDRTGELVRGKNDEVIQFRSADLSIASTPAAPGASDRQELLSLERHAGVTAAPPAVQPQADGHDLNPIGGVMLIGSEKQALEVLRHFGPPRVNAQKSAQQLLAIPCHQCAPDVLLRAASQGVATELWGSSGESIVGESIAGTPPVLHTLQLQRLIESLGQGLLQLEAHYCLVTVRRSRAGEDGPQGHLEVDVTARDGLQGESSPEGAARRALSEGCGIEVSDFLWERDAQLALRHRLGTDVALQFEYTDGDRVMVLMLPHDAIATRFRGALCFSEPPNALQAGNELVTLGMPSGEESTAPRHLTTPEHEQAVPAPPSRAESQSQRKTIAQWEDEQDQFQGEALLPPGWLRIKSRTGSTYYYNKATHESTFKFPETPLPEGWVEQVSRSTGRTYYFHENSGVSTFERPRV